MAVIPATCIVAIMVTLTAITVGTTILKYLISAMVLMMMMILSTLVSINNRRSPEYLFQETLSLNFVIVSGGDYKI